MKRLLALVFVAAGAFAAAQDVSLEYQVKAAYLFNFTKFVEWPPGAIPGAGPLTICMAELNPFGPVLETTLAAESAAGRPIVSRVVRDGSAPCHVLFVPRGVPAGAHLRRSAMQPVLTVGESANFLQQGGVINFVLERGRVRFEINREAAARGQLTISARLLQLARLPDQRGSR